MTKEELEKEAEEFTDTKKSFWRQGRTCIGSVKQAYIAGAEPREKRIAELEKENAELKEKLEESEKMRDFWKESSFDWRHKFFEKGSTKRLVKKSKRLTKAKEIIKRYVKIYVNPYPGEEVELRNEAEQFLNSEVEK